MILSFNRRPIMDIRHLVAGRVAQELQNGDVVNLGIGLPTLVADYIPEGVEVTLQSEHGILGSGPLAEPGKEDPDLINAGGRLHKRSAGSVLL